MKKSRILLVWPYFPPDPGAAAARGAAYQKYLSTDYDVSVITKNNHKFEDYKDSTNIYRLDIDVSVNPIKYAKSIKKLIEKIKNIQPEMVIVSSPNIILAFYVARAASILNLPFYLDVRDLFFSSRGLKYQILKVIDSYTYKNAKKIFVTTQIQKEMTLEIYNLDESKLVLVPNGIDISTFGTSDNKKRPIDLLFQGSINPERNVETIIELLDIIFSQNPKFKVTFVGVDRANEFVRNFEKTINQKDYSENVSLIEEVDHKTVLKYIAQSKLGLVSLANNEFVRYQMPVKVFEYMAYGAVIAAIIPHTKKTSLKSFISRYNCGVYSNNAKDLADKIIKLIKNSNQLEKIKTENFETVKLYDRRHFIDRVKEEIK